MKCSRPSYIIRQGKSSSTNVSPMYSAGLRPSYMRVLRTPRSVLALMLREMVTTYGRSPGGYLWAILDPVAAITLLSFIFSQAFHAPALGASFPLFYATGYLPFMMFNDVANKIGATIRFSRPLLSYPAVTFLDAVLARFLLNTLTHVMVFFIVVFGIWLFLDALTSLDMLSIVIAMTMAASLALGIGTLNCYLMTAFPLWERIWQIATRPLFIISGVFFLYESLPETMRNVLWFNPLTHVIGEMRRGFYPTYDASYVSYTYVFAVALISFAIGLALLYRYHRDLLNS